MSTINERRGELVAALVAEGIRATDDPNGSELPYALVFGGGVDTRHIVRGQLPATFRVVLCAGAWDGAGTAAILGDLVYNGLRAFRALDGWSVGEVAPDRTVMVKGGMVLAAQCNLTVMIDLED